MGYGFTVINGLKSSPTKSGPPLLRIAHLMAFTAFLRQLGAPVDRDLRHHGLPVSCEDPDAFVPLLRIWSFFKTAARNEDSELGWLVGAHVGDHELNSVLLRKLETAPTLLQALCRLKLMASTEATDLEIGIEERQDDILFYTRYSGMGEEPGYEISQAYQLGIFLDLIRHFLGRQWGPDEIGIESPVIPSGANKVFPGSRILTQQPAGYIAVSRCCLHRHPHFRDAKVGRAENPLLNDNLPVLSENFDYLSTLRELLKSYLSEGYVSQRVAAELMNTSVRTLTRRLSTYGLTYGTLIDGMRFNAAKKLLRNPDMRIGDVAHSVGFKDQADFTRMFHRVGGMSPKEFRNSVMRN
jgi:AraC-like DNA-binding protein